MKVSQVVFSALIILAGSTNATGTDSVTPVSIVERYVPEPKENVIQLFYMDKVKVELTSGCSKPVVKFTLTTTTNISVTLTTSTAPCNQTGYETANLTAEMVVSDSMKMTVSKKHPSIKDDKPNTYQILLKALCDKNPCADGETCVGDTKTFNCTCPGGYGNGTVCIGPLIGANKLSGTRLGIGPIVGIAVAGLLVLVIIAAIIVAVVGYNKQKNQPDGAKSFGAYFGQKCSKKSPDPETGKQPKEKVEGTGEEETDVMLKNKPSPEEGDKDPENKDSGVEDEAQTNGKKEGETETKADPNAQIDAGTGEVKFSTETKDAK